MTKTDKSVARIVGRQRLAWRDDGGLKTPHPRAGSGLATLDAHWGGGLVLAQDDVSGLARVDPLTGDAFGLPLPAIGGLRRFDPGHGAKKDKPDLESVVALESAEGPVIWAFGSGSTPRRERLAVVRAEAPMEGHFVTLNGLYDALRHAIGDDSGGEVRTLNIEGACVAGGSLILFQRGNGAEGRGPASIRLSLAAFEAHLKGGRVPSIDAVDYHDLGHIDGVAWGFTDADLMADGSGRVAWIGSAEATANTFDDGKVLGSVFGILEGPSARIVEADGRLFTGKAEGLAMKPHGAWLVVDPDDPDAPAEILEVALEGPW
jgi:hypothetical protein